MNTNKFLMATVGGAIVMFATAFLIYGLLLPAIGLPRPESVCLKDGSLILGLAQDVLWAGVIAYIFAQWAGIKTFKTGLKSGAGLGFVFGLLLALAFYGTVDVFDEKIFAIGPLSLLVRFGLAGGVIGWILGRE